MVTEYVPIPDRGRTFTLEVPVRLSDTGPDALVRLDGIARFLQDVATDDWDDTGIVSDDTWVVRRTALRGVAGGRWPVLKDKIALTTWCGGVGAAWAERRTDLYVNNELLVQSVALWVPIDPMGHPVRVRSSFFDVYGEATQGRKVSGRVSLTSPPPDAQWTPWPLRRSDLDVVGHVNNAAVWQAVSEVVSGRVHEVEVIHHGPIEGGNDVRVASTPGALWLVVGDDVRVAAHYSL